MPPKDSATLQAGVSMIEVLVTLVILAIGLLGLAGLQAQSQRAELESYQRVQALVLIQDMAGRINTNRQVAPCYAFTTNTTNGTPFLGVGASSIPPCTAGTLEQQARANQDLSDWNNLLQGTAEQTEGNRIGAMVGARGCVSFVASYYLISIAWQGWGSTTASPAGLGCGRNLYGNETQRRVVSMTLQIANLD